MHFLTMATWDDIVMVLELVDTELIGLAVALVLAVVATFAVAKLQKPLKKLIRGSAWVAFAIVLVMLLNMAISGPLYSLANMVLRAPEAPSTTDTTEGTGGDNTQGNAQLLSDEAIAKAQALCEELAAEGIVLLKNDGILPLGDDDKLNTFGWSATNPVYGGTGSGTLSDSYPITTFLQGLEAAGIEYNTALTDFYTAFRDSRPSMFMEYNDWTNPEPTQEEYEAAGIYESALAYSDIAVFYLARSGGESADLPTSYSEGLVESSSGYTGHSEYADDLDPNKHYLELTNRERATLERLNQDYENIIVIVNAANTMELGFIEDYENIRAAVLIPGGPGQTGFNAVGKLLNGTYNFSGKTVDTYIYDLTHAPTWNNFGHFAYDNMSEFMSEEQTTNPTFINYVENIYVGYKFWETAAEEDLIDYDEEVIYPFGYGLSYTTFTQELVSVTESNGQITVVVNVTNTGDVAGKDVVQVYYNPPYTNGGIEKASANLIAFAKTSELAPDATEEITLTWATDEMSSYDENANNGAGAYVLEAGNYVISINSDSHNVIDSETLTLAGSTGRASDVEAAVNQLQWAENDEEITYLSRKDGFANYDAATAAPASFSMSNANKAGFYNHVNYDPTQFNDPNDEMPTTGAVNNLDMNDMRGLSYDDPLWEFFLDQLTVEEMVQLISLGGYMSTEIASINKTQQNDCDGPASINRNGVGGSIGFTAAVMIAATWNTDLAYDFGESIGEMADEMDVSGWYAPAMNIHRSAFSGRNFEYYSEDGFISGKMAAAAVRGAETHGVYSFIKHFAINDQETNRTNMLCSWLTEQAAREIYMRSFEIAVKEGGADAVMSAFNYVGNQYAGACDSMLNQILRDEWGFVGMVLTDYFGGYAYMDADIQIRNGGDFCLSPMGGGYSVLDDQTSATSLLAARQACKNILYVTANSRAYATEVEVTTPAWQITIWAISAVIIALLALVEVKLVLNYKKRVKAAV